MAEFLPRWTFSIVLGASKAFSEAAKLIVRKLSDETVLKRARIHPLAILIAEKVYAQGRGDKGSPSWKPVPQIIDALDEAFFRLPLNRASRHQSKQSMRV